MNNHLCPILAAAGAGNAVETVRFGCQAGVQRIFLFRSVLLPRRSCLVAAKALVKDHRRRRHHPDGEALRRVLWFR